jgi:predicted DNA-binding antitoxin AbrB/MazE fold protein
MAAQETLTISAIYKNGVLRPLEPLDLPEHTRVQVAVTVTKDRFKEEDERIRAIFAAAGVPIAPRPADGRLPMTSEELTELGRRIGAGRPVSEIVSEERESAW